MDQAYSKNSHDIDYYNRFDLDWWYSHNKWHQDNSFSNDELKLDKLLMDNPDVRGISIDIGAGGGWLSKELSNYFSKVIAIEPSEKAQEIAKLLYPNIPNIEWKCGFAEDILTKCLLDKGPIFINTCSVFQHLEDNVVEKILVWINSVPIVNSTLSFQELWGDEINQSMHHSLSKKWWQDRLSNWCLDFHGPIVLPGINKGIHGIRI